MAERIKVTVQPSGAHPEVLTVQDAMRQVLDVFELLTDSSSERGLVWSLANVSMNSPFTAVGEAVSFDPSADVTAAARAQKAAFARDVRNLTSGRFPSNWSGTGRVQIATRLMRRNLNGVGLTRIYIAPALGNAVPINLTPAVAQNALSILAQAKIIPRVEVEEQEDRTRDEYGSLEGILMPGTSYYNSPALRIQERKTKQLVWCNVPEEVAQEVSRRVTLLDLWAQKRVRVRGLIKFNAKGEMVRMLATDAQVVMPSNVPVTRIVDAGFTGGLSAAEYLEKFREGDLGLSS